jgi:hypothetical protein
MPVLTRGITGKQDGGGGGTVPTPTEVGQLLASLDGTTWSLIVPLVSPPDGWLANDDGELLYEGLGP